MKDLSDPIVPIVPTSCRHSVGTVPARSVVWLLVLLAGFTWGAGTAGAEEAPSDAGSAFFAELADLCGARFVGEMTFPDEGRDDFAGQVLVAEVESCTENEIRIPFHVGEDRSRTWILSMKADGLELKHDHRHADGTPDEVTMYGGTTSAAGTASRQSFPADAHTVRLIPEAATNVWTLELSEDHSTLTYHLERHGEPRFTAVLRRDEASPPEG